MKWITKTIVKVITWVEEIVVEKILQSETEKYEKGSYSSTNNVILNGDIYYGSNAAVDFIIDVHGIIANKDVTYETTGNDVKIKTFSSMANLFSRVGIAYALVYLTPLGANAIWWSIPAGWAVGSVVSLLRVKSGKWKRDSVAEME